MNTLSHRFLILVYLIFAIIFSQFLYLLSVYLIWLSLYVQIKLYLAVSINVSIRFSFFFVVSDITYLMFLQIWYA